MDQRRNNRKRKHDEGEEEQEEIKLLVRDTQNELPLCQDKDKFLQVNFSKEKCFLYPSCKKKSTSVTIFSHSPSIYCSFHQLMIAQYSSSNSKEKIISKKDGITKNEIEEKILDSYTFQFHLVAHSGLKFYAHCQACGVLIRNREDLKQDYQLNQAASIDTYSNLKMNAKIVKQKFIFLLLET